MRRRLVVLIGAVVALPGLAACGSSTPPNALQGKSPSVILNAASGAATKLGAVHYVLQTTNGNQKQTVTGDATTNEGAQYVVNGTEQAVIQLMGTTAFIRGNASGLSDIIGLSSTVATQYAGKWLSLQPADPLYQSVVHAVTLKNVLAHIKPTGSLIESTPGIVAGHNVVGVHGDLPASTNGGTVTWWVATTLPSLLIGAEATAVTNGKTVTELGTFSRWGERFLFKAPSGAVPFSSSPTK